MTANTKEVSFGLEGLRQIKVGVDIVANAVKSTLGPRGRNVIIERGLGSPSITKDGVSVAKEIDLADPLQNLGASLVKDAASRAGDEAGDGTTSTSVLAQAIFDEGFKLVAAGSQPIEIKRGIDKVTKLLMEEIRAMARPVTTKHEVASVGAISANNEQDLGDLIAEAMDKVGKDGVVTIDESGDSETTLVVEDGYEFDRGWKDTSRLFLSNVKDGGETIVLDNPMILAYCKPFNTVEKAMRDFLTAVHKTGRPLLVIAPQFSNVIIDVLGRNCQQGVQVYAVTSPGFGENREAYMEDLVYAMGGYAAGTGGLDLERLLKEGLEKCLGSAEKAIISRASTVIIGGRGNPANIQNRIASIRQLAESTKSDFDKEKLQERMGKLSGGIAVIRVGGNSEVEVREKKDRVEDALCATRAAVLSGIVPGGGVALLKAKRNVSALGSWGCTSHDQVLGCELVLRAVEAPIRCIVDNAGGRPDVVVDKILNGEAEGYNAHTGEYQDLMASGVIDPAKVTLTALSTAASIAGTLLTTNCAITITRSNVPEMPMYMP